MARAPRRHTDLRAPSHAPRVMVAADLGIYTCRYGLAYSGACGAICDASGFCEAHTHIPCQSCGEWSTHQCSYAGQFVCGAPLCDDCTGGNDPAKPSGSWGFLNHFHQPKLGRRKMVAGDL